MNEITFTLTWHPRCTVTWPLLVHALESDGQLAGLMRHSEVWATGSAPQWSESDEGRWTVTAVLGGSMSDAWCAAALMLRVSSICGNDMVITMLSDSGDTGDFLLAEAAEQLPEWCDPEMMAHRVAITMGVVVVIPVAITDGNANDAGEAMDEPLMAAMSDHLHREWQSRGLYLCADASHDTADAFWRAWMDAENGSVAAVSLPSLAMVAISRRVDNEVHDALHQVHRACAVVTTSTAKVCWNDPGLVNAAIFRLREWTVLAAEHAKEAQDELGHAFRLAPHLIASVSQFDREEGDDSDAVKVSLTLPRYTFALAYFTRLPHSDEDNATDAETFAWTPRHVVTLGAQVGMGLALIAATEPDDAGWSLKGRLMAAAERAGNASRGSLPLAQAADLGDGLGWMKQYAAEAAEREAHWAKGDVVDAILARLHAEDDDNFAENSSSGGDTDDEDDNAYQSRESQWTCGEPRIDDFGLSPDEAAALHASGGWQAFLASLRAQF